MEPDPSDRNTGTGVLVLGEQPRWLKHSLAYAAGAAMFVAPLFALVLIWAIVVPLFGIDQRVFPSLGAVAGAALESIRDGSLIQHIGASLLRVGLGTLIGVDVGTGVSVGVFVAVFVGVGVAVGSATVMLASLQAPSCENGGSQLMISSVSPS